MNIKDFCKEANKSPLFKKKWKLKVSLQLLKNLNYAKRNYVIGDLILLDKILADKEFRTKYGDLISTLEEYDFILNTKINSYSIKKFLLLMFSDKFQQAIQKLKKKYKIPEESFEMESQEFRNWYQPSKQSLYQDASDLFKQYHLRFFAGLGFGYILFRSFLKTLFIKFRLSLPSCPCNVSGSSSEYEESITTLPSFEEFLRSYKYPYPPISNDFPYAIIIPRPVSKEELLTYIDKNWQRIKKEQEKCFGSPAKGRNFQRDFLIFTLYKNKSTTKGISEVLKFKNLYIDLSKEKIKKIIKRQKERIKRLEGGT